MHWTKVVQALCVHLLLVSLCTGEKHPEVKTSSGVVRGRTVVTDDGKEVDVYLGIPFAAPASGSTRFAPPKDVEPWRNVLDASSYSQPCYQLVPEQMKQLPWVSSNPESEDCLKLNIWVPKQRSEKTAVMIWIHGGGFAIGSTDVILYDGSTLATRENVIVVSVNYRLAVFGFLYLAHPEAPGNVGLMDQAAGMRWVKNNIEFFGGDPERVTIFGESAGGASVGFHLLAPSSLDLYRNAILQSGTPTETWATDEREKALESGLLFARNAGCPHTRGSIEEAVKCLQKLSAEQLMQVSFKQEDSFLKMVFKPVVDRMYLPSHPSELLSGGKFCGKKNVMVGNTREDGAIVLLMLWKGNVQPSEDAVYTEEHLQSIIADHTRHSKLSTPLEVELLKSLYTDPDASADQFSVRTQIMRFLTDRWFECGATSLAEKMTEKGNKVYAYRFDHVPASREGQLPVPRWLGSMHGDEMAFLFGLKLRQNPPPTEEEITVAKQLMRYWANFAKKDDPNDEYLPVWPKYSKEEKLRLQIDGTSTVANKTDRLRECHFWENTFHKIKLLSKEEL